MHQEKVFPLLWSCVRLRSVSCTSNWLAQMCDFRKCTELLLMLILSLRDLLQNQNLEIILVYNVVLHFTHNNIVGIHLCDECTRSSVPSICHKRSSILWPHEQVCSQTIKYLPTNTSKYRHFWTICEQTVDNCPTDSFSSSLSWWSSIDGVATLYNCWVFYSQVRNFFHHISLHGLPCRGTQKIWFVHQVSLKLL